MYLLDGASLWLVFAIICLLDLATAATVFTAARASIGATALMAAVLVWLLFGTVLSWNDLVLRVLTPL